MKSILWSVLIVLNLNAGIFDYFQKKENIEITPKIDTNQKIKKLRIFEQTVDAQINNDLQSLNGYLENEIMKNFNNNSVILAKFSQCYKREKTNLVKGNVGTRIYTIKCYQSYKKDYYNIYNEKYIDKYIDNINTYLTKKYNLLIIKKAKILNINPVNYQQKHLSYSIDTIPNAKREYINAMSNITSFWNDIIKNVNTYDQSFGWLDNMKLLYYTTPEKTNNFFKNII